jgi:hypothetical protein
MDPKRLSHELDQARRRSERATKRLRDGGAQALVEFRAAMDARLDAERALAAARNQEHAVPFDLGVQWDVGAPLPHLLASGLRTFLAFYLSEPDPDRDGTYAPCGRSKMRRRTWSSNRSGSTAARIASGRAVAPTR